MKGDSGLPLPFWDHLTGFDFRYTLVTSSE
jgi:hypothetical protein